MKNAAGHSHTAPNWYATGTTCVISIALVTIAAHLITGSRYGFDRDELMALDDARHLAWGYVQYPPMTAFLARIALEIFGASLVGFRLFAFLAMAISIVLTGLIAKQIGGGKWAQITASLAAVPFCLGAGALMQYMSFDFLCWLLVAYCTTKVATANAGGASSLESRPGSTVAALPPRLAFGANSWWLALGAAIGLGMLAKYTMAFLVVGVVVGVLASPLRKQLCTPWPWLAALLSLLIFSPNLFWQAKHHFVSLEFLRFLHTRDVATGQTDWFLPGQLELTMLAFPLALAGLWYCFFTADGRGYRILGWMYLVPLALFLLMRGRDYYLAPAYPMLYAAGAVWLERKWQSSRRVWQPPLTPEKPPVGFPSPAPQSFSPSPGHSSLATSRILWLALILDILVAGAIALPTAPVNSRWWEFAARVDTVLPEEIGWPEFVQAVAEVRDRLPVNERAAAGILAGNYGEVGALNLYGEKFGLPRAISGVNSSWERGYGDPPDVLIVVGYPRALLENEFASCVVGGKVWNRYGVRNEETVEDPDIFVCRGLKGNWDRFWRKVRKFA